MAEPKYARYTQIYINSLGELWSDRILAPQVLPPWQFGPGRSFQQVPVRRRVIFGISLGFLWVISCSGKRLFLKNPTMNSNLFCACFLVWQRYFPWFRRAEAWQHGLAGSIFTPWSGAWHSQAHITRPSQSHDFIPSKKIETQQRLFSLSRLQS